MKVLAVASEIQPLVKTGGLADVVGALPAALAAQGIAVSTLIPGYPAVLRLITVAETVLRYDDLFGGKARLLRARAQGLDLFLLDSPSLFAREGGPYADAEGREWPDNWRRFAALGRVGADIAEGKVALYRPALVHAHDWQAGLTPAYLRRRDHSVPTVFTIHNMAFQGRFDAAIFPELGLPQDDFAQEGLEYFGGVGFLKAGLYFASTITTVSPTYAQEILTTQQGMGLEGLLRIRPLTGIVNGIDGTAWNPATDVRLARRYGPTTLSHRRTNRAALQQRFGLTESQGPIFCVISRLTAQKGIDLVIEALDALLAGGGRLAVLGSGDAASESALQRAAASYPGQVGVQIGYDEGLAHLLQGGADAILIPSRFEPCGLTQLYGLRYGCLPIVARTGGLADTVIDANEAAMVAGVATGFQFWPADAMSLRSAVARAIQVYAQPKLWTAMQRRAMRADFSWRRSAERYAALFASVIAKP
jgi:starch synthase